MAKKSKRKSGSSKKHAEECCMTCCSCCDCGECRGRRMKCGCDCC